MLCVWVFVSLLFLFFYFLLFFIYFLYILYFLFFMCSCFLCYFLSFFVLQCVFVGFDVPCVFSLLARPSAASARVCVDVCSSVGLGVVVCPCVHLSRVLFYVLLSV